MNEVLDVGALRLLQAIRDRGTLTAAGEALGVSQPAVSQHVRRLERRLGTALLVRSGRTVRLTEAGEVLARHGESVSAALRAATAEVAALTGLRSGVVRLAAFPSANATLVPRALARLRAEHPGLTVRLEEVEPPESLALVRQGAADVVLAFTYPGVELGRGEDDLAGLTVLPLLEDPTLLAVPAGHPLATAEHPRLRDAAEERWIAGCPRCRGHLLAAGQDEGFVPDVVLATDDHSALLGLVAAELGVALLPGLVAPVARGRDDVVLRSVLGVTARTVQAVTSPELLGVPAVAALLEAVRASAQESAASAA
ncbi:MAG TPA: LysR family transcriptional regulator [Micrococcales bacterium]|uniref:LysR family transcriptional regulator n=1 Tax=Miniimonas arenae TaxID=676201 RepID=UPI000ED88644|nr:LysR family transcriptional regulator [Miniimonas arenae]HCX85885.1 LysR family transcriptional regulator [Micrococcales bacterium]